MTVGGDARPRAISWQEIVGIFAVVAALYTVTFTYRGITDTELNSAQTRALVLHGDIDLARYHLDLSKFQGSGGNLVLERDRHVYSVYGVGVSLVAAPFYAPLARLGVSDQALQGVVSIAYASGAVVALLVALLMLVPRRVAVLCAVVFAFGTSLWTVAAMAFFQQAPVLFFSTVAVIGVMRATPKGAALAGFGLGMAVLIRPTMAIPLAVIGLFHVGLSRLRLVAYAAGAAAPVLALVVQNRWVWGSWLKGGYSPRGLHFDAPFGEAFGGLLIGWWRGILVYTPFVVLGIVGWLLALRGASAERERLLAFMGLSVFATILLYSRWPDWGGGLNQFGYRLLLETFPFLFVLCAYGLGSLPKLFPVGVVAGALSVITMSWGMASSRDVWDAVLFARRIGDTPIGRAWGNFFDHPGPGVARLAAVAVSIALFTAIVSRSRVKPESGESGSADGPGSSRYRRARPRRR